MVSSNKTETNWSVWHSSGADGYLSTNPSLEGRPICLRLLRSKNRKPQPLASDWWQSLRAYRGRLLEDVSGRGEVEGDRPPRFLIGERPEDHENSP